MKMPPRIVSLCLALLTFLPSGISVRAAVREADIVVYGATAGGVAAAIQAVRMGKSALIIESGVHIGGLTSGGLGATDIGNKAVIGGISREFYVRIAERYEKPEAWRQETRDDYLNKRDQYKSRVVDPIEAATGQKAMWTFEPRVAEQVLEAMLAEAKVPVHKKERLDLADGVEKSGERITGIKMESGNVYRGKMFIDATYEGDLLAKAGVSYHVGREANAKYQETLNGVQMKKATKHQFNKPIDPYIKPGDPTSGLLPGIQKEGPGEEGAGDHRVQAYNFRLCLTDVPENRMPIPKPEGYDPMRYELLLRYIQAGVADANDSNIPMPNRKTDINNNGGFSSDNIGMNYAFPEGDYATRDAIFKEHVTYQMGMWWFLANDPRVPEAVRAKTARWGLTKDEFTGTGGWPHQLYVREARRMVSDYVMTEHHCRATQTAEDSVGMGAYNMDSHNVQRYAKDGRVFNEGDIQERVTPYPISYRSIVPKATEASNLLVPVCLSATHIAYGSIRMEPVFMVLGQSAATAASLAIDRDVAVQKVPYDTLRKRLLADKQVLEWKAPAAAPAAR